jgi:intein/homing endonuclease
MPRTKKPQKTVKDLIQKMKTELSSKDGVGGSIPDIVSFCEKEEYLNLGGQGITLYPMQKLILKIFYRGSAGNENIVLTEEEIQMCKDIGCNTEERGDLLTKFEEKEIFRQLILIWGRRCVSEDATIVDPSTGYQWTFGELWDNGRRKIDSWTYNENSQKMEIVPDADIIYQGKRQVYKLTTNSGHEIECTNNHPFLTQRGWVNLEDLDAKKDKVTICESIPFFGTSDAISEDEAAILGYMTADGNCSQSSTFFTCANKEILKDFTKRIANISDNLKVFKDPWTGARSADCQYKITSKEKQYKKYFCESRQKIACCPKESDLQALLSKHELRGKTCHYKCVPDALWDCPKNIIAAYLRALFSCDGCLLKRNKGTFEFSSVNKEQSVKVQSLLVKFGIVAQLRTKNVNSYITDEKGTKREYHIKSYVLHFSSKKYINTFLKEIGLTVKQEQVKRTIKLKKTVIAKDTQPIVFSKIRNIEKVGIKRTFDLSVSHKKSLQNFTTQGLITHNSGKDFLCGIIMAYEAMRLLECPGGNPYAIYGLSDSNPITILTVATAAGQATLAFNEIKTRILHSPYFQDKFISDGIEASKIFLLTPRDKNNNDEFKSRTKGSIVVEVGHSNSDALLGKQIFVLLMDEVASYKTSGGSSSGERIFTALTPSLETFGRTIKFIDEDGEEKTRRVLDSKLVCISSPRGEEGLFYRLYKEAHLVKNRLMCKLPTWHVNTKMTEESIRENNESMNKEDFLMEYGAEFSGTGGESFFVRDKVLNCFKAGLKIQETGRAGFTYFAHLDPATTSHNYALVIIHRERYLNKETSKSDFRIVVDQIKYWKPEPGKPVRIEEVDDYVMNLRRKFHLGMVTYDIWNSIQSIEKLKKAGVPAKCTHFSAQYKMAIYTQLEVLMNSDKIWIPRHKLMMDEMLHLQRKITIKGFRVSAPKDGDVRTDDCADALAGACYVSMNAVAHKLPGARLVNMGVVPSSNAVNWRSMSGESYGTGTGGQVARQMETRQPQQGQNAHIPPSIFNR